jgi:hypothetical protein
MRKIKKHYYSVRCSHYSIYNDEILENAVGKDSCGSGSCFTSGERDLEWNFDHLRQAVAAIKILLRYKHLNELTMDYVKND